MSPTGVITILAVEDEPSVLGVIRLTLERAGYRVLAATSAQAAISLSMEHAASIQLLLLDVVMPDLSGPELRDRLQTHLGKPDIPTIFTSGYPDVFFESGQTLLDKPFSPTDLLKAVQRGLAARKSPSSEKSLAILNRHSIA